MSVYASESDIIVNKTASSATVDEPGGIVTYTVEITNTSINGITITGLSDTMNPADLSCTVPFTLAGSGVPDLNAYTETYSTTGDFGSNDNEFSGVTYNHSNGNVIIVDDEKPEDDSVPSNIYVYSTTVATDPMIPVTLTKKLTITTGTDIESIAWMFGTTYAILSEDTPAQIHIVDLSNYADGSTITVAQTITIAPTIAEIGNSSGAEGIAFQFGSATSSATITNSVFYVVQEGLPDNMPPVLGTLYEINGAGMISRLVDISGLDDVSDVYYGAENGEIYLISDESQQVVQLGQPSQINWSAISIDVAGLPSIPLNGYGQAEGLAFDAHQSNFIVVSELGNTFGRFTAPPSIGESIVCTYTMNITGQPDAVIANTVTVTATHSDRGLLVESADADVEITDIPSSIAVTKTADPTTLQEPGGVVTYAVVISNESEVDAVTINALDDTMGVVDLSCTLPATLAVGGSITCTYTETVNGSAGDVITNTATVSATDDDGNALNESDSADVTISPPPSMSVSKTANVSFVQEPGGVVTYTVLITNTSAVETITVTGFADTLNPANVDCTPAPGTPLAPGEGHICTYAVAVTGNANDMITNTVTITATDENGDTLTESDDADVVIIEDVPPSMSVSKTADSNIVLEPGGIVTYTVLITNTSVADTITVTGFADTLNPANVDCTPAPGTPLAPGEGHVCTYAVEVTGNPDDVITNTVTITATDDDGGTLVESATATVTIDNALPSIAVSKVATPTHVISGTTVTYTVLITNTSPVDTITVTGFADTLNPANVDCTPAPGTPLAPGEGHVCTYSVVATGSGGDVITNTVTITATDDDGEALSGTDTAAVTIKDDCDICINGASKVTIELVHRDPHGDRHERIRVRTLDGTVLFDTYYDGNPYGHNGLYEGESFMVHIPNPGEEIVITVQGRNHRHETVKAQIDTNCGLAVGDQDGNSYIKFEVIEIVTDNADQQQCEEHDPPAEPCEACVDGASQVTVELVHRASHGDRYERIRVRQSDGTVLFDTYYDGDPYGHYGLFVGESFTITVPNPGEELMITVQGENHRHETVKAWFDTDCHLMVGDQSGNSYIKFEVIDIVTDSADQCVAEENIAEADGTARSSAKVAGLDVSLFMMADPEMPMDEAIGEDGEIVSFSDSAEYSGDIIFMNAEDVPSDYSGDVIIIDITDSGAPETPTAVTFASQTAWVSSMSVFLFTLGLLACTTAVTRRF